VDVTDMTAAPGAVVRAGRADAALVGGALADAFRDDPVFGWLIPEDTANRERRLTTYFASMSRSYLRRDKPVYLVDGGRAGALWSSPGAWALPLAEIVRESRPAASAFGRNLLRALRCQLQVESLHPKTPQHWYLGYLGTRCADQGKGVGSALLREVLQQADSDRLPSYLESSCERNLTLYERHGFRVVEELRLLGRGPSVWRMWREPQESAPGTGSRMST
jgi:ribosomal protein S18 acetylase RimI-like enzyme